MTSSTYFHTRACTRGARAVYPITEQQGLPTGDHLRRGSPISPRRTPEEPWDVTFTTSDLTSRHYWCAPSACEVDLQDLLSVGYAYHIGNAYRAGGDGP